MGIFDPQGLPSSPTTQSTTTSNINAWAQPYVMNYLNQGNALLNAPPTEMQKQAWGQISNLQTPGQFGQGTDYLNQAAQGQLGTTGTALGYGSIGNTYGGSAQLYGMNAGQKYATEATSPGTMQAYMNPYIQNALNPQLELLNQQQALNAQNIASKAAGQGAFGGNRATLAQGLNAQNYALAGQKAIGEGYNTAFNQARQAQQFGSTLGLEGVMRGNQVGIQGAQTGLQGIQGAQQGYAGATQAGVGLGNIGAQLSQADLARIGLLNTMANQQYNLPFQRLNFMQGLMSGLPVSSQQTQGYQAAPNKLSQLTGALGSLASYAPAIGSGIKSIGSGISDWWNSGGGGGSYIPNEVSWMDNRDVGITETPLSGMSYADLPYDTIATGGQIKDGGVKRYAEGGIASIDRKVLNNPTDYSAQTINRGAQNNLFGDVTKLLALDTIAKQKQALQNQQAMQQQARPPVLAQLQQQAMMQQMPQGMPQQVPQQMAQAMPQGIDSARSNLPQQYAGGGIIAFDEGGTATSDEKFPEKIQNLPAYLRNKIPGFSRFADAFSLENLAPQLQRNVTMSANAPTPAPTDAKPDELGRYKAGADSGIVIHDNAPRGLAAPSAPTMSATPAYKPAPTSGIDELVKGYESMIKGGEDFKKAESDAERSAFRKTMLGMMAGKSPYFFTNLGEAGLAGQEGLDKSLEGIQARKDKQITQLMGLGLKGQDLKNEAQKLGISEAELQAKLPLYQSEVAKNLATAKYIGSGKGGAGGKRMSDATLYKITQEYKGYSADPKSAPFFSRLPQDVRTGLTKYPPGSTSYNNALAEFNKILQMEMVNEVGTLRALGAGSSPSSDSLI